MSAQCRSCNAPIFWAETTKGKTMPMDAEPTPNGKFVLEPRRDKNPIASYVKSGGDAAEHRYESHYATCPEASSWRKKG